MLIKLTLFTVMVSLSFCLHASQTLYSSVSPEFPNGLHAKYLRLIADKMKVTLVISPMPYARRIQSLRSGQIDIMVGLRGGIDENTEFTYVEPSYESLKTAIFVLANNKHKVQTHQDLAGLIIGTSIGYRIKASDEFIKSVGLKMVRVTNLQQKINLLMLGRVDMFTHFEQSSYQLLQQQGLEKKVVLANVQFTSAIEYFVAVSTQSKFSKDMNKINAAVESLTVHKAFIEARKTHYAN